MSRGRRGCNISEWPFSHRQATEPFRGACEALAASRWQSPRPNHSSSLPILELPSVIFMVIHQGLGKLAACARIPEFASLPPQPGRHLSALCRAGWPGRCRNTEHCRRCSSSPLVGAGAICAPRLHELECAAGSLNKKSSGKISGFAAAAASAASPKRYPQRQSA